MEQALSEYTALLSNGEKPLTEIWGQLSDKAKLAFTKLKRAGHIRATTYDTGVCLVSLVVA